MKRTVAGLALLAASASYADLPRYWSVHVDRVADRATYERVHTQELQIQRDVLAKHNVARPTSWKFGTEGGVYYNLRGRASLAELDKPSPIPEDAKKEIASQNAPLDPRIHASLRDHHNEIWETDTDLTSLPDSRARKYLRFHSDNVRPGQEETYTSVTKVVRAAMEKRGVAMIGFFSAYGDGVERILFMSDQPFDVRKIVPASVMKQWKDCVVDWSEVDAKARPDLTVTDPSNWIQ